MVKAFEQFTIFSKSSTIYVQHGPKKAPVKFLAIAQPKSWTNNPFTFTCSKSTIKTLEKDVKYVQSYQ